MSICLVEAGPDYGPYGSGRWPKELLDPRQRPVTHDWGYVEERSGGFVTPKSRARVVGGCSVHNQCAAIWAPPEDYDAWASLGNPGWKYSEIQPFITRIEHLDGPSIPFRGKNGPIHTRPYREHELSAWQRLFLESSVTAGFATLVDHSDPEPQEGVAPFHVNVKNSVRWNAAFGFLDPVRNQSNLTIISNTMADRLIIRGQEARSLVCRSEDGDAFELKAPTFVLSAGTYSSPLILMRSGIGPQRELTELGIEPQINLPGVGKNLHDHAGISILYEPAPMAQELLKRDLAEGRLSQSQVILRARSRYCRDGFDLNILPYQELGEEGKWTFEILVFNMTPQSRGQVLPRGTDPKLPPAIQSNYFSDQDNRDSKILTDGLRTARQLSSLNPIAEIVDRELEPGEPVRNESDLLKFAKVNAVGFSHPVGTCKMGSASDSSAVVDATGLVRGSNNIFVADASIMPTIPRAPINMTCFLIGMRVVHLLQGRAR